MSPQPHEVLRSLTDAAFAARCLHVVADLGVADQVADTPVPVAALASACDVDADALDRVLRVLAAHGVFASHPDGYAHTPSSRLLRNDHPMSMRSFAQMVGSPLIWGSLGELGQSVRTGKPGVEVLEPQGLWAYLHDHPDEAEIFGRAMTAKAGAEIAAVLAAYDFTQFSTIADIGGGRGHLLSAILDAVPTQQGTLFDLPQVISALDVSHPRMSARAGDFFVDALPEADAYVLMEVLHDWSDEECVTILRALRRACGDDATLLVVEGVIPEGLLDVRACILDVIMLCVTGGRERTAAQLSVLFDRAGFRLNKVLETASPMRIVEARPA